jgi:DNA-binding LacI/PurR family transcriptional regulator
MTKTDDKSPRFVAKQEMISETLRRQIIDGQLAVGGRLPTQVELAEQFQVSGVTIQRALDRLTREGFVYARGRNGTFVASHPPHLCSYGVIFKDAPSTARSRYHELLETLAIRLQRSDRRVMLFNNISGKEDTAASRQLLAMVRSHQLAGLLLIDADGFLGTPLLDEAGICRAAIMSNRVESLNCPIVFPDLTGMVDLALDHLLARGRRRVGSLSSIGVHESLGLYLRRAMQARGIEVVERWQQILPHNVPDAIRNNVLLLMSGPPEHRPDGLFIIDDNLVEAASGGLVAAGMKVPGDVEVVAHCNFPWSVPVLPMQRVGFDTMQILTTAIGVIDQQRQGQRVASVIRVPALLESSASLVASSGPALG